MEFIFKRGADEQRYRPTISIATYRDDEGTRRAFAVANVSGKYMTDAEARDLALEKADKNGFKTDQVITRDMETHEALPEE